MIEIKDRIELLFSMELIEKINIEENLIYFETESPSSKNEYTITLENNKECNICRTNQNDVDKFKLKNNYIIKTDNPDQPKTGSTITICKKCLIKTLSSDMFYYIYK